MKPHSRSSLSLEQSATLQLPVTKRMIKTEPIEPDQDVHEEKDASDRAVHLALGPPLKRSVSADPVEALPAKKARKVTQSSKRALIPVGSVNNILVDSLRPGLLLIMVGVNPSIETGKTGHAYSHPTNKFWKLLHESNITPVRHKPADTHALMDLYGIGHTNVVSAASVAEKDIPKAVYQDGVQVLDEKIRSLKPEAVALVGKNVWENWFQYKIGRRFNSKKDTFQYGWQIEEMQLGRTVDSETGEVEWEGARTYVLPTSSAACAFWNKDGADTRVEHWLPLGEWFAPKRSQWIEEHTVKSEQNDV